MILLLLWGAAPNILISEIIYVLPKTVCTEVSQIEAQTSLTDIKRKQHMHHPEQDASGGRSTQVWLKYKN